MLMDVGCPVETADWKDLPMSDEKKLDERPGWVRLIVGARSTRRGSMTQMCALALLGCIGFAIFAVENGRTSQLARIGCMIGLAGAAVALIILAWAALAVRWIDRNGKWV